jgi:protein TonB
MSRTRRRIEVRISLLDDPSLARRLRLQLAFAFSEARRDPAGFARSILSRDALDARERRLLWSIRLGVPVASGAGFFLGVLVYVLFVGIAPPAISAGPLEHPPIVRVAPPQPQPNRPGEPGGGGGGGGDHDPTPVSRGQRPPSSLRDPIVPATTKPVPQMPDPLPVPPPIKAPELPTTTPDRYGDPTSTILDASDGPGSNGGAGTGDRAGWGPGHDRGAGPDETDGAGGPAGPGGRPERDVPLATRAVILNAPRPAYTDLAREHHTQGTVQVRVLLGADGRVKQARVHHGLPDGLDERAIAAVYELRFRPATGRDGRAVDSWVTVSVNFTIR